jgi:hypothetical protein
MQKLGYTQCRQNDISESELLQTFSLDSWFFGHSEGPTTPELINILPIFDMDMSYARMVLTVRCKI